MSKRGILKGGVATAAALALASSSAAAAAHKTLYVSPKGKDTNKCTRKAPCRTITHGVLEAAKGDTVRVARGTYAEEVDISKGVTVVGVGRPFVNAKGQGNGFKITGPGARGAVVRGFLVKNATFEGILAESTSHVAIIGNVVRNNDQGGNAKPPVGECAAQGEIPGDCGEAVHLMSVTDSVVSANTVTSNAGGILLTDEAGPTARNVITRNNASNNKLDCGITVAGHSPAAVSSSGKLQPKVAGIYRNVIAGNVANGNGTKGEGAGILLAAGGPGSAVYNNLVLNNTANGNGLAGVTLHSHAPGQDLNGNRIIGNRLNHDGVDSSSESEFGENGKTVGILVGSGVAKLKGIVITANTISNSHYGIFTKNVPKISKKSNTFHHVAVPLKQV